MKYEAMRDRYEANRSRYSKKDLKLSDAHIAPAILLRKALEIPMESHDTVMISRFLVERYARLKNAQEDERFEQIMSGKLVTPLTKLKAHRQVGKMTDSGLFCIYANELTRYAREMFYPSSEEKVRLRELELSVHDISVRSDIPGIKLGKTVPLNFDLLPEWAERWRPRLIRPNSPSNTQPAD